MARKPDTLCAGGCGRLLWTGTSSLPNPTCQPCRRQGRAPRRLDQGQCGRCGQEMQRVRGRKRDSVCASCRQAAGENVRRAGERTCQACGRTKPLAEFGGVDKRGWLKSAVCYRCQAAARPKNRRQNQVQNRKRRDARYATWDGVTDREVLEADWWECQMPRCLRPEGREIPQVSWPDPWSPSVDHVLPLSLGGTDTASNKRAAHLRCNVSRGNRVQADEENRREIPPAPSVTKIYTRN